MQQSLLRWAQMGLLSHFKHPGIPQRLAVGDRLVQIYDSACILSCRASWHLSSRPRRAQTRAPLQLRARELSYRLIFDGAQRRQNLPALRRMNSGAPRVGETARITALYQITGGCSTRSWPSSSSCELPPGFPWKLAPKICGKTVRAAPPFFLAVTDHRTDEQGSIFPTNKKSLFARRPVI